MSRAGRSKIERETIICFNEEEDLASIYTFDRDLKKRLRKFSDQHPDCCWLESCRPKGSESYMIEKDRLSIRFMAPMNNEQKARLQNNGRTYGFRSEEADNAETQA